MGDGKREYKDTNAGRSWNWVWRGFAHRFPASRQPLSNSNEERKVQKQIFPAPSPAPFRFPSPIDIRGGGPTCQSARTGPSSPISTHTHAQAWTWARVPCLFPGCDPRELSSDHSRLFAQHQLPFSVACEKNIQPALHPNGSGRCSWICTRLKKGFAVYNICRK